MNNNNRLYHPIRQTSHSRSSHSHSHSGSNNSNSNSNSNINDLSSQIDDEDIKQQYNIDT